MPLSFEFATAIISSDMSIPTPFSIRFAIEKRNLPVPVPMSRTTLFLNSADLRTQLPSTAAK